MTKLTAYTKDNRIYVPCPFCKVVHGFDQTELVDNRLPCCCSLQVKRGQTVHSPYEHGFTVEIVGEYTEAILKHYLASWRRRRPNLNEDIFY